VKTFLRRKKYFPHRKRKKKELEETSFTLTPERGGKKALKDLSKNEGGSNSRNREAHIH